MTSRRTKVCLLTLTLKVAQLFLSMVIFVTEPADEARPLHQTNMAHSVANALLFGALSLALVKRPGQYTFAVRVGACVYNLSGVLAVALFFVDPVCPECAFTGIFRIVLAVLDNLLSNPFYAYVWRNRSHALTSDDFVEMCPRDPAPLGEPHPLALEPSEVATYLIDDDSAVETTPLAADDDDDSAAPGDERSLVQLSPIGSPTSGSRSGTRKKPKRAPRRNDKRD